MRIALVSDIHSNLAALEAVLRDIEEQGADEVWCLGDTVGYGPDPSACVAKVRHRCAQVLSGNHDLGAVGLLSLDEFNPYAAAANRWTGEVLSEEDKAYLSGLPSMTETGKTTLAHGSPREPVWEYVLSSAVAALSFDYFKTELCFVGHSHVPFVCWQPRPGGLGYLHKLDEQAPVALTGQRAIINPGSVGQPRDGDPRASYALYDVTERAIHHRRVSYDIEETQRRMQEAGLPGYLIERLAYGH